MLDFQNTKQPEPDEFLSLVEEMTSSKSLHWLADNQQRDDFRQGFLKMFKPAIKIGNIRIVIVGAEKSGKTTLLSSLFGEDFKQEYSCASMDIEEHLISKMWVGGVEFVCITGSNQELSEAAWSIIQNSDLIVQVSDLAVKRYDVDLYKDLIDRAKAPVLVVLNKSDLYPKKNWNEMLKYAERVLGDSGVIFSAKTGENLSLVIARICASLPQHEQAFIVSKLTNVGSSVKGERIKRQKLVAKERACEQIIRDAATKAADIVGQRAIPGSDIGALMAIDAKMILDISNIYELDVASAFGAPSFQKRADIFIKMSSQVLVKFLPGVGILLGQALALNWIVASGKSAMKHFQGKITLEEASNLLSTSLTE